MEYFRFKNEYTAKEIRDSINEIADGLDNNFPSSAKILKFAKKNGLVHERKYWGSDNRKIRNIPEDRIEDLIEGLNIPINFTDLIRKLRTKII